MAGTKKKSGLERLFVFYRRKIHNRSNQPFLIIIKDLYDISLKLLVFGKFPKCKILEIFPKYFRNISEKLEIYGNLYFLFESKIGPKEIVHLMI